MTGLITQGFHEVARSAPGRPAITIGSECWTYGEIAARAALIAGRIDAMQARRVGLCLDNGIGFIETFVATVDAGAVAMVMDPMWPDATIKSVVTEHAPAVLVGHSRACQVVDASGPDAPLVLEGDGFATWLDQAEPRALRSQATPDMPFLIGFTSGSSGRPKAFIRNHATWIESFDVSARELGTRCDDVILAPGPLSHGLSLFAAVEGLASGASIHLQERFDAVQARAAIARDQVTALVVVPTMLDMICNEAGTESPTLRRIVTAGSKLSPALRETAAACFPNAEIIEYYGASELSFISVARGSERVPPGSVGRACAGVDIEIRDQSGASLAAGQTGTVWIRSGMISSGYVGTHDGTGFRQQGDWATVGDLGHLDSKGFLTLDGRASDMILSGGYNIYPAAIEAVLADHPDIAEAVVFPIEDARWGEIIAAAIEVRGGRKPTRESLEAHCLQALPRYALPRRWLIEGRFPRTASGKADRASLRSRLKEGT